VVPHLRLGWLSGTDAVLVWSPCRCLCCKAGARTSGNVSMYELRLVISLPVFTFLFALQTTYMRPRRRTTRHASHILLIADLTFIALRQ